MLLNILNSNFIVNRIFWIYEMLKKFIFNLLKWINQNKKNILLESTQKESDRIIIRINFTIRMNYIKTIKKR